MEEMTTFLHHLDNLMKKYPEVYLKIEKKRTNKNWRVQVFGRDMGKVGDAELLFAEAITRDEAFAVALLKIGNLENQIISLKESRKR